MRIMIIGGNGFLGTSLARRLHNTSHDITIGDITDTKSEVSISSTFLDVEDENSLKKIKHSDAIINLAAVHRDDVKPISRYDDVNVQGAINVCNAAREFGIEKIIFTSSVAIYGFAPPNTDESGEPNFFNDYGRTKYLAEQVYKEWYLEDEARRSLVIIRPTVIFGEGNRGNVYNLLKQINSKKFIMVGNGNNKKSMAYVENVAAFLEWSLQKGKGVHIYNYIDKPDFDMNALVSISRKILFGKEDVGLRIPTFFGYLVGYLADIFSNIVGRNLPISSIRVKKFLSTSQFSSTNESEGFEPPVSLEDALLETLHYEFLEDNSNKRTFETE